MGVGVLLLPGILYFVYRRKSRFVAFHSLQALLFMLLMLFISAVAWLLKASILGLVFGWILFGAVFVLSILLPVFGGVKALKGERWIYPFVGYPAGKITQV
jgi:uncharacterized membrane protein